MQQAGDGVSAKVAAAAAALGLKLTKSNGVDRAGTGGAPSYTVPGSASTEGAGPSAKPAPSSAPVSEASKAAAAAALAAVGMAFGGASKHSKVTVTETRRFAGKDIQVTLQVCVIVKGQTPVQASMGLMLQGFLTLQGA
jgi:hypothetical protein